MIKRVLSITAFASLVAVAACGDNTSADDDFSIDDEAQPPAIADDGFEGIDVIVADACGNDQGAAVTTDEINALDVNDPALAVDNAGGVGPVDRGDDLVAVNAPSSDRGQQVDRATADEAAAPAFCNVEGGIAPETAGDSGVVDAAQVGTTVCECDFPGCVGQAIDETFGCGVCVTFGCGEFDRSACVECEL